MISIKFNQKSVDRTCGKLDNLSKHLLKDVMSALENVLEKGQEQALEKKIGNKSKEKVLYNVEENKGTVKGNLKTNMPLEGTTYTGYTAKSYAPMVEFGTGRLGDLEKLGTSPTFVNSGYSYWYVPLSKAPDLKERISPNRIFVTEDGEELAIVYTQPPRPFMRPTASWLKDNASKILSKDLKTKIRSDIK